MAFSVTKKRNFHQFLIKKFTKQTIESLNVLNQVLKRGGQLLTLGRWAPVIHLQPVHSLRYLMDSNCSSLLRRHCINQ